MRLPGAAFVTRKRRGLDPASPVVLGGDTLPCPSMPELPDVTIYCERLAARTIGATLERVTVVSPNLLRTAEPSLDTAFGRRVTSVSRVGKRIVLALEGELFLVLHLMIAGRLRWRAAGTKAPGKVGL